MAPTPVFMPENINEEPKLDVNEVLEECENKDEKLKEIEEVLEEEIAPRYWAVHMNFQLDSLMDEL